MWARSCTVATPSFLKDPVMSRGDHGCVWFDDDRFDGSMIPLTPDDVPENRAPFAVGYLIEVEMRGCAVVDQLTLSLNRSFGELRRRAFSKGWQLLAAIPERRPSPWTFTLVMWSPTGEVMA